MNVENAEQEVERMFRFVDKNNSGSIDYTGDIFFYYLRKL